MAASFTVRTGKITLTASSTKSLILLNPVTSEARITEIGVSLDASTVVAGVEIDLYIVSSLGSPTGTTGTSSPLDPTTQTATTTSLTALTAEPTTKVTMNQWFLQPVGGLFVVQFPLGREPNMQAAGARWGIQYVTPSGVTPDVVAYMTFEE